MPPKYKFTREEMIDAAVRVTRIKGIDAVTARDIADELGVSTQPIFTCFHTMEEAKREIRCAAERIYRGYAERGLGMPIPFYGFGMQYIRFAREEPELYKLLFLTPAESEVPCIGHRSCCVPVCSRCIIWMRRLRICTSGMCGS